MERCNFLDDVTFFVGATELLDDDAVQKAYKAGCCCVQPNLTRGFTGLAPAWLGPEAGMDRHGAGFGGPDREGACRNKPPHSWTLYRFLFVLVFARCCILLWFEAASLPCLGHLRRSPVP